MLKLVVPGEISIEKLKDSIELTRLYPQVVKVTNL
jgi:hypothetical protein